MVARRRTSVALVVAVAVVLAVAAAVVSPAKAWLWSGDVVLQGTSHCGVPAATWVWVQSPNGESGWATNGAGRYYFHFHRVPGGGMTVRINYGEAGFTCHDSVYVRRPVAGSSLTVNLVHVIPNG